MTTRDWKPLVEDLAYLVKLAEEGEYQAVIDRIYEFDDIVEAHKYVDTGRKKGNVVVRIGGDTTA